MPHCTFVVVFLHAAAITAIYMNLYASNLQLTVNPINCILRCMDLTDNKTFRQQNVHFILPTNPREKDTFDVLLSRSAVNKLIKG